MQRLAVDRQAHDGTPAIPRQRPALDQALVESVDVVPTILEALGVPVPGHRIEGRSLAPLLHGGEVADWRDFTYSELDYGFREARRILQKTPQQARAFSIRNARWRYVYWLDEPEQLYDLEADPDQMNDLGRDAGHEARAPSCAACWPTSWRGASTG
ncbi:MAG TPA: sulfatase/phosphatase domain-containing protein [Variovorax sp.]|nr:sulfatase/phosphatase domain-containing protein [Variovorax sp.]